MMSRTYPTLITADLRVIVSSSPPLPGRLSPFTVDILHGTNLTCYFTIEISSLRISKYKPAA